MSNYVPHTEEDIKDMLAEMGKSKLDELYKGLEPLFVKDLKLPNGKSQQEIERLFSSLANQNKVYSSIFLGAGAYNHYIPSVVKNIASRQEFLTAYTPYQAEISQGILQTIFEYQSMIARLCGMEVSNASVYDGSTALADGILMLAERRKNKVLLSSAINPRTLAVVETYLKSQDIEIEYIDVDVDGTTSIADLKNKLTADVFAVALAQPNFFGVIENAEEIGEITKANKTGFVINAEPISMALLKTPFECNADVATGDGQPLGMPLSFGGPYLGFIATTKKNARKLVGRIVGKTEDNQGRDAYVLTLQAREQHIRREKASSSICSNQAHCALVATLYMATMGKEGMVDVAKQALSKAHYLANKIKQIDGFELKYSGEFFKEFVIKSKVSADKIIKRCKEHDILAGLKLAENEILWCVTEMNLLDDMNKLVAILREVK